MRILTHLRQSYPTHIYESTFLTFFHYTWSAEPQLDLSVVENVVHALKNTYPNASTEGITSASQTEEGNLPKPAFTAEEIQSILKAAATAPVKDRLKETTDYCVKELGAFGCPYFWVINDERSSGSSSYSGTPSSSSSQPGAARWRKIERNDGGEPFFGSDRWHYIWEYLDIPWSDVRVLRVGEVGAESEADKKSNEVLSKL
jgi:glutathione S-transferase kappa 1